jgi:hypothetical protein
VTVGLLAAGVVEHRRVRVWLSTAGGARKARTMTPDKEA